MSSPATGEEAAGREGTGVASLSSSQLSMAGSELGGRLASSLASCSAPSDELGGPMASLLGMGDEGGSDDRAAPVSKCSGS